MSEHWTIRSLKSGKWWHEMLPLRCAVLFSLLALYVSPSFSQGIPFLRNFTSADYHAHNRNFDVETGENGTVFAANFEGLMYYDQVEWRIIHTPGITRVTVVLRDKKGTIWAGGYNYFGRIVTKPNGELDLQQVGKDDLFRGEVMEIWEEGDKINFFVTNGIIYEVEGQEVRIKKNLGSGRREIGLADIVNVDELVNADRVVIADDVTQTEPLEYGLSVVVKKEHGLIVNGPSGKPLYTITEKNGLCNDNVAYVVYDGHGKCWGVTDNGVFSLAVPSAYSHYSSREGLIGEVLSIDEFKGKKYVGTSKGLFRLENRSFLPVPSIGHACWDLLNSTEGLLAATANGVYRIMDNGTAVQLTTTSTSSLLKVGDLFYAGELDGVYLINPSGKSRTKVCRLTNVTKMAKDGAGTIWLQNLYGEVWYKLPSDDAFIPYTPDKSVERSSTIVATTASIAVINSETTEPFPFPLFSYIDKTNTTWLTDSKGKSLYRWKGGKRLDDMTHLLTPISDLTVRAMFVQWNEIWIGSDNGITVINTSPDDPVLSIKPTLRFRSIRLNGDSVLWGGFGEMPQLKLKSNERDLRFTYAIDYSPLVGSTMYRYKLNDGSWSVWEEDKVAEFISLPPGSYTLAIQARFATGELSEVATLDFKIASPFYVRWYMNLLYLLLLVLLVYGLFRFRLHRLNVEKEKLEKTVQERTADLRNAQRELIRQEKMATVGKLTQGLIDRILNPLNYINNFSKLSEGLVKDIEANIEDDKDNMDSENYEDTMDVLGMLRGNLQKVSEHGQNTTRTLKAMEEMLKDRSGGIVPMDLVKMLRQDEEMLNTYYANDIRQHGIKTVFDVPQASIDMKGNAEQLSKTLMSILGNAVYAVVKKAQREKYQPEVSLKASIVDANVHIAIRDNGIGIEPTIIGKIFDPFFTTKTTGEAAGVGLYLSHEIIQNHGGTISVESEKNVFTEFIITLPIS